MEREFIKSHETGISRIWHLHPGVYQRNMKHDLCLWKGGSPITAEFFIVEPEDGGITPIEHRKDVLPIVEANRKLIEFLLRWKGDDHGHV